jgi:hypothetical protein
MKRPVIVDGRNLYRPETMTANGFVYYSMGRRDQVPRRTLPRKTNIAA